MLDGINLPFHHAETKAPGKATALGCRALDVGLVSVSVVKFAISSCMGGNEVRLPCVPCVQVFPADYRYRTVRADNHTRHGIVCISVVMYVTAKSTNARTRAGSLRWTG